jgi:hypothetical protein
MTAAKCVVIPSGSICGGRVGFEPKQKLEMSPEFFPQNPSFYLFLLDVSNFC